MIHVWYSWKSMSYEYDNFIVILVDNILLKLLMSLILIDLDTILLKVFRNIVIFDTLYIVYFQLQYQEVL